MAARKQLRNTPGSLSCSSSENQAVGQSGISSQLAIRVLLPVPLVIEPLSQARSGHQISDQQRAVKLGQDKGQGSLGEVTQFLLHFQDIG
ncbi:MAG: hypothetical protein U9R58_01350 [Chloroflexota bacterium]|nr:hypothetical protein [Chloroflexota bacterium]